MKLRVLGCSGSIAAGHRTTSFLLDHDVLIDAGTGVGDLTLDELAGIDHILLSHSHLDHVLGIPLLADCVMQRRMAAQPFQPLRVHALEATLDALRQHLFNDVVWPDFTRLPLPDKAILELLPLKVGDRLTLGGKSIEVLPALHTVPAVGYGVDTPSGWWIYTGDTGPNPALWPLLADRQLAQVVIETAFGDEELALAKASRHLAPHLLREELSRLAPGTPVAITHMKPGEVGAVMDQIDRLAATQPIVALQTGDRFEF
jgi:ribonuclease BN (tRNA processing enzyme)